MSNPNASAPLLVSLAMIFVGLLLGIIQGIGSGSLIGGLIAAAGIVPACYAAWMGVQKETQTTLLWSILLILASLAVGGLLVILWLVSAVF